MMQQISKVEELVISVGLLNTEIPHCLIGSELKETFLEGLGTLS